MSANQPRTGGFPRWAIVLLAVAGAIVVTVFVLVVAVIVEVFSSPAFGPTPAGALAPESCLAESGVDLPTYTVVDCESAHAQQVVAEIDLSRNTAQYTTASSLASYAGEV